ncbi:MAG: 30S ribosomal protein S3 [Thermoguttaceae bacterium]|nr:30S ribosomal protein S3 [Thermoguttaceae bacterium]
MGQKVNPVAFRVGVMEGWKSRWYAPKKEFAALLVEDKKIRDYIKKHKEDKEDRKGELSFPGVAKIEIERTRDEVRVIITTARPGLLIGRKGEKIEELQAELQNLTGRRINLKIEEEKNPELVAQLVAEDIGEQLVRRASFRRVIKHAMAKAMEKGAKGVKIQLSGRLGGAEMARCEKQAEGSIPLSTLRAKIDYGFHEAKIAQGHIGIQVWINQGEYSEDDNNGQNAEKSSASKNTKRAYKR